MSSFKRIAGPIVLILFVLTATCCNSEEEKIFPVERSITESVYSSVTVQPDSLYQAHAAVAGILEQNLLEEGDSVAKGTPILQIINSAPELNSRNARLNLELAMENFSGNNAVLTSLRDEILAAELQFKNDSINYFRQKNLWEQQIGSKLEYDNRKLAFELSASRLSVLKSSYERTRHELETKVRQAENNYQTSLISTEDFTVSSKINGTVYALYKNPGELVSTLEPVAAVGSSDKFVIEMLVDEVDIVKLQLGDQALITLDAYENTVFEAVVSKIYPRKDERSQTFKVEAVFKKPPEVLYPGLAGEGNIVVARKEKALIIPKAYLTANGQVRTEEGLKDIRTGLQSLDSIEIVSGIDAGTSILKPEE
ncbi:HlyD family efflux transporter periplasmic adaptor subunit [Flavobacteriaceae bacterium R33]|uniref:HlyD family efflux transporter periplasmic adaptor subunit n=2 Tax=Poritiphilus flavus TaxID=2697053 RepID=A0A6L9EB59_9FLAO|nr:HlyD family efflux transporter periplasmic adaptor subunit [Poritiphilus flavus]